MKLWKCTTDKNPVKNKSAFLPWLKAKETEVKWMQESLVCNGVITVSRWHVWLNNWSILGPDHVAYNHICSYALLENVVPSRVLY